MKKININKDVESRRKIATTPTKPIVKPSKPTPDAKSEESKGAEIDTPSTVQSVQTSPKVERKTKRNL